jgi:hypothetical protein
MTTPGAPTITNNPANSTGAVVSAGAFETARLSAPKAINRPTGHQLPRRAAAHPASQEGSQEMSDAPGWALSPAQMR